MGIRHDGSSGGILIMWDSRVWMGSCVEEGKYSITYKFEIVHDGFVGFFLALWEEIAAIRELCGGPRVTWGLQHCREQWRRRGSRRITNVMADFSSWIEDMELHDPHLNGGTFTVQRATTAWEVQFENIRQQIMPRVISDHNPVMLQCGDWEQRKAYFKFENGDNNTKFFQRVATTHRRCNTIDKPIINGEENKDPKEIKDHITKFYKRYTLESKNKPRGAGMDAETIFEKEVVHILKLCDGDKALGPGWFYYAFSRSVGDHKESLNATFVVLIPKLRAESELKDFRPISLIGGMYKIIAKPIRGENLMTGEAD
ncbi:hypothetical protein H5410_037751 [Solanum commersonii]|uniref:Uncharacterized protein n=1 Tax=Solanum commersonii TaxID=4109 RepID=A0A9J5Y9B7_SOLCO|nr:hypothetical protein H5410_037751 [Solanum commersonii]